MNLETLEQARLEVRREPDWFVATLLAQRLVANDAWNILRMADESHGPAARIVAAGRGRVAACAEVPAAFGGRNERDRRLRRRLLARSAEAEPDVELVTAALDELPGTLAEVEGGWSFKPAVAEAGPIVVRAVPGGLSFTAKLAATSDFPAASLEAVGMFLMRVQKQLRMVRIAARDETIDLAGWADAECLAEDAATVVDALVQTAPRLRRLLAALSNMETAQAYARFSDDPL